MEDYDILLKAQNYVCAICQQPESKKLYGKILSLCLDHEHETRTVRGLLCAACNAALGAFHDDPKILLRAVAYLADHARLMVEAKAG